MLLSIRDQLMVEKNWKAVGPIFINFIGERLTNVFLNGDPYKQFVYTNRFIFVALYDLVTKGSVAVPIVTAIGPTLVIPTLVTLQLVFNIFFNDWFAEGNVFLIVMQVFTIF